MAQQPVLIIGAGLGGLTLASALQKHGIPYKIFERDSAEYRIAQGYRITLSDNGIRGLAAALTPEQFKRFEETCGEHHFPGGAVDGPSGAVRRKGFLGILLAVGWATFWEIAVRYFARRLLDYRWYWSFIVSDAPKSPTVPAVASAHRPVDRRTVRSVLLKSHMEHVSFGRAFQSYVSSEDGVTAIFEDGSRVTGCLLVGADGVRSRVAKQLLGRKYRPPIDLGVRIIYGKTPLTSIVEGKLHSVLKAGTTFVTDRRPGHPLLTMVLEAMRFRDPEAPENYVFWALCVPSRDLGGLIDPEQAATLTEKAAADLSLQLTLDWDQRIRVLMEQQKLSETAILRLSSSSPDGAPVWDTDRRVTLLGDAIHAMPPTGGQGANTAMHDAALLADALRRDAPLTLGGWARSVIRSYEDAMRYHIGDIVGLACIGACRLLGAEMKVAEAAH